MAQAMATSQASPGTECIQFHGILRLASSQRCTVLWWGTKW